MQCFPTLRDGQVPRSPWRAPMDGAPCAVSGWLGRAVPAAGRPPTGRSAGPPRITERPRFSANTIRWIVPGSTSTSTPPAWRGGPISPPGGPQRTGAAALSRSSDAPDSQDPRPPRHRPLRLPQSGGAPDRLETQPPRQDRRQRPRIDRHRPHPPAATPFVNLTRRQWGEWLGAACGLHAAQIGPRRWAQKRTGHAANPV